MAELKVTVRNKIAIGDGSVIVCDNNDYTVKFDLDSEWESLTNRTMIVAFSDHTMASPVLFTGDTATLPQVQGHEIAYIGLKAGNMHTTTAAAFQCARSISTIGGTITPPTTEVWNQIIAKLDEIEDELEDKQDTLTAGTGISIVDNVISATGSASVTRSAIETALGSDSPNLSANDYSNTEKAAVTANTAARHTHDNKAVLDTVTSALISGWTAASTWVTTNGAVVLSHLADTVKHITASERTTWNSKQDSIDDLSTIRSGAALGATAIQEHQDISGKQDVISDLATIRSGAALGATAIQEHQSLAAYRTAAAQDAIHDATKQDVISDIATIRSGAALGATALQSVPSTYRTAAEQDAIHDSTKVDVVAGKGLSTNDYDNAEKAQVAANASAITSLNQAIVNKEATANKVTALTSESTDTQYPSAKCVYDLVGNVESLLEALL